MGLGINMPSIHLFNKYVIPYDFPGIVLGRQDRQALCSHGQASVCSEWEKDGKDGPIYNHHNNNLSDLIHNNQF